MSLLFWLFVKHFVVDFPLQAFPYQYKNKGTYGHPGGLLHAGLHGLGTMVVVFACARAWWAAPYIGLLDAVAHYHIDWAKMNLTAYYKLTPTNSEAFWILLGFDQWMHTLCYFVIVGAVA